MGSQNRRSISCTIYELPPAPAHPDLLRRTPRATCAIQRDEFATGSGASKVAVGCLTRCNLTGANDTALQPAAGRDSGSGPNEGIFEHGTVADDRALADDAGTEQAHRRFEIRRRIDRFTPAGVEGFIAWESGCGR